MSIAGLIWGLLIVAIDGDIAAEGDIPDVDTLVDLFESARGPKDIDFRLAVVSNG